MSKPFPQTEHHLKSAQKPIDPITLHAVTGTCSSLDSQERDQQLKRLTNLLQALPGAVLILDGAGKIQEFNPAAAELLGEPLQDQSWSHVVTRAFAPRWDDGHDISLVNGRVVNISTQPMIDEPGQILLIKDVTETRQLQAQLNQAKRLSAKGEMAAALAHQVRTPLASAMLYLSNLQNHKLDAEAQKKFTAKALTRLKHLERVIEDMLLFARGGQFTLQTTSLSELITELAQHVKAQISDEACVLEVEELVECHIPANRDALSSALQNLIDNAFQAGKQKKLELDASSTSESYQPTLIIRTHLLNEQMVQISLEDNGPGIPDSVRERVFEPFVTSRANGTGLGLAVVQAVIRSHQGSIYLRESSPAGTRFEITLPVIRQTQEGAVTL